MQTVLLTKNQMVLIDDDDFEKIKYYSWYASYNTKLRGYYAMTQIKNKTIYMHRLIMGFPDNLDIDHINKNTLDNRKENLRICTRSQNQCNRPKASHNKSGYKGVWYDKPRQKWHAEIQFNNKKKHLGRFETAEEAALYRDAVALQLHGEFVHLNFPNRINEHPIIDIKTIVLQNQTLKTSLYRGVYKTKSLTYQVNISISNKTQKFGTYKSEILAALIYDEKAEQYHNNKANINFLAYSSKVKMDPNILSTSLLSLVT